MVAQGPIFEKILRRTYEKLMKKCDLRETQNEHVIIKKSYKNFMNKMLSYRRETALQGAL